MKNLLIGGLVAWNAINGDLATLLFLCLLAGIETEGLTLATIAIVASLVIWLPLPWSYWYDAPWQILLYATTASVYSVVAGHLCRLVDSEDDREKHLLHIPEHKIRGWDDLED